MVGVNRFTDDSPPPAIADPGLLGARGSSSSARLAEVTSAGGTSGAVRATLGRPPRRRPQGPDPLMPPIVDAVRARATLGEISDTLRTSGACTGRRSSAPDVPLRCLIRRGSIRTQVASVEPSWCCLGANFQSLVSFTSASAMPTYEYQCPEGHDFEKFQKMTDKPRAKCPVCGKPATRKISGGAGLVFKGSGFYITDYGKDGKGPRKAEPKSRPPSRSPSRAEGGAKASPSRTPSRRQGRAQAGEEGRLRVSDALRAELARVAARLGADGMEFVLERPRDAGHGDLATNLAMVLARRERANPRKTAERVLEELQLPPDARRQDRDRRPRLHQLLAGRGPAGRGAPAHPRGRARRTAARPRAPDSRSTWSSSPPIPPGRSTSATDAAPRWATPSPSLLEWTGHAVTREFYINDAGVQIDKLAQSLWARVREAAGHQAAIPEGGYHGEYLKENAREVLRAGGPGVRRSARGGGHSRGAARSALRMQREEQDRDLAEFGVRFDVMSARSRRSTIPAGSSARSQLLARARAHATRPTARSGSAPPSSATTRTACSGRATARSPTSCPTSPTTSTSTTAASTARSTSGAPITTGTSRGCGRCSPPWAIRRSSSTWRWCSWSRWCGAGKR